MTTRATYTKLRDGNWGIRVKGGAPAAGAQIRVKKKAGTVKVETIDQVVWRGDGITLCSIRRSGRSAGGTDRCAECRGPIVHARHHRAMGGLCGSCAFDEFDC